MDLSKHERKFEAGCPPLCWLLAGLWLAVGCAPEPLDASEEEPLGTSEAELITLNSLTPNGLTANGLSLNGLSLNGLSLNGLQASAFASWFNSQPASVSNMVMRYLIQCAVPAGQSRTWTNPSTGTSYTWAGGLGLTPSWAGGNPTTELEEQLITACLAAHVNKYGVSMHISLVGRDVQGAVLATTKEETDTYSQPEASFYGNLFRNEGVYVCKDPKLKLNSAQSTLRACAIGSQESGSSGCGPIVIWGTCGGSNSCQPDSTEKFYSTCSHNGKAYQVLSTRIRPRDIYTCGDGICQTSESCGTGTSPSNCTLDCGICP